MLDVTDGLHFDAVVRVDHVGHLADLVSGVSLHVEQTLQACYLAHRVTSVLNHRDLRLACIFLLINAQSVGIQHVTLARH